MTIDGQKAIDPIPKGPRACRARGGAIDAKSYAQRRACALVGLDPKTYRYRFRRPRPKPATTTTSRTPPWRRKNQTTSPPANPARFTTSAGALLDAESEPKRLHQNGPDPGIGDVDRECPQASVGA